MLYYTISYLLYYVLLYNNTQFYIIGLYIMLHCITLHTCTFTVTFAFTRTSALHLHYTTLHYTALHYITLHYITLHHITLHYFTLLYFTLHYITLHYITLV